MKIEDLLQTLRNRGWKLGLAESCTGGLFASRITSLPGVSDVFWGSLVCYSNDLKVQFLKVMPETLNTKGAVSQETVLEMASGAKTAMQVDWSVAITGIAGPTGGTIDKPVGTVWFGVAGPKFVRAEKRVFAGDRQHIQSAAVDFAVEMLSKAVIE